VHNSKVPVLICGFVREEGALSVAKSALEAGTKRIYFALDGPRNEIEAELQERMVREMKNLISNFHAELKVLRRLKNLGLSVAIISALDWFFESEDRGIILEDDLVIHKDFYSFAAHGLTALESDPATWIISGNQFFTEEYLRDGNQWSHYPLIWGWACWSDKWASIRNEILKFELTFVSDPGLKVRSFLRVGKFRVNHGKVNSWAIPFSASMKSLGKFCYMPPQNFVSNIGLDAFASHTVAGMWHLEREIENFGYKSDFLQTNRERIASNIDRLIEDKIYHISWKSFFSLVSLYTRNFFANSENQTMKSLVEAIGEARLIESGESS